MCTVDFSCVEESRVACPSRKITTDPWNVNMPLTLLNVHGQFG